jgi:hypothetical protein
MPYFKVEQASLSDSEAVCGVTSFEESVFYPCLLAGGGASEC